MQRLKNAARAGLVVLVAGCATDAGSPLEPPSQPREVISDAARGGPAGFYWLPPVVLQPPSYSGPFDAGLQPRVEVCRLVGGSCGPLVAVFPFATQGLLNRVRVNPLLQDYHVLWTTHVSNLDPSVTYRMRVLVDSTELGFADLDVIRRLRDLRDVDFTGYAAVYDDGIFLIRFRLEKGIAREVMVSPPADTIPVGGTASFTASVTDLHGNPIPAPSVSWTSSDTTVATVDGNGLAVGVGPGTAAITATSGGRSGTAFLTVADPNQPPVAVPDTFDAIGNVTVPVSASGVLVNDTDPDADPVSAVAGTFATAQGGTFTVNADGSFTYRSAAGFTGQDEVSYEVTDGVATASSTVTFVVPTRVWYVSNAASAPGDGRDASPFTALKDAEAASLPGETIFVLAGDGTSAGLDAGVVLKDAQALTGQGISANVTAALNGESVVLLAAGGTPQLTRAGAGVTIALAQDNTVQGVDVASTAGAGIAGAGFGTLTAGSVSVAAAGGPSLDLSNGTVAAAFGELSSAGSAGTGLRLASVGGVVAAPSGSIVGAAGTAIEVSGGDADVTYGGDVASAGPRPVAVTGRTGGTLTLSGTIASTGQGILAQGNAGGTIAFTGASKSLSTGANHGVELASNTGAAVHFGGGGLAVATTTGEAFRATGGGTVTVTGAGNTLTAAGGAALRVANTAIGASGMTFRSISADGGANGIVLENSGSGGLQVTGDGASDPANPVRGRTTAGAAGNTLAPGSGGTITGTAGAGVSLGGAASVVFRNLEISDNLGDGIRAEDVAGLTLDNVLITGHPARFGLHGTDVSGLSIVHSDVGQNATQAGAVEAGDIWNLRLDDLTGTSAISHSRLHHSQETVLGVINAAGSLDLTISNTDITDTGVGAGGGEGVRVSASGSATVALTLMNDSIARTRTRGVTVATTLGSAASVAVTVTGSHFADNQAVGVEVVHGSAAPATFTIAGNDFQRGGSVPINVNRQGSASFTAFGPFVGTISGNVIGAAGIAGSGTATSANGIHVVSNGAGGSTRVAVAGNTIRRVGQHGIYVAAVDAPAPGTVLQARVEGNSIDELAGTGLDGVHVLPGALGTDVPTVCLDVRDNVSNGVRNGLRARTSGLPAAAPTIQLEDWDGATPVATYFAGRNTLSGGVGPVSVTAGSGTFAAVAACDTP